MTNPNKALSDWLLRKVFQLKEGELATYEKMNKYKIDKAKLNSYDNFIKK